MTESGRVELLRGRWFRNLCGRYGCLRQFAKLFGGHELKQNSELSFGSNNKGKNCFHYFYYSLYKVKKKPSVSVLENTHH